MWKSAGPQMSVWCRKSLCPSTEVPNSWVGAGTEMCLSTGFFLKVGTALVLSQPASYAALCPWAADLPSHCRRSLGDWFRNSGSTWLKNGVQNWKLLFSFFGSDSTFPLVPTNIPGSIYKIGSCNLKSQIIKIFHCPIRWFAELCQCRAQMDVTEFCILINKSAYSHFCLLFSALTLRHGKPWVL